MNRVEIVLWTDWVPDEDELKELRRVVREHVAQTNHKAWVETDAVGR